MSFQNLSDTTLTQQDINPASYSSAQNGTGVDLQGWDGCEFLLNVGAIAASGTLDAKLQSSSDNSTFADISNAAMTQLTQAGSGSNKHVLFDIKAATVGARYVRIVVTPATAASIVSVTSRRYRHSAPNPPTQNAQQIVAL